ncbi:MAG: DUF3108 domain-containing protein [Ignavibacteriae bacterium]|nr:DUF3108 domain-containing protein [Ignavibacteriota bacterium]
MQGSLPVRRRALRVASASAILVFAFLLYGVEQLPIWPAELVHSPHVIQTGEELVYEVTWTLFKLGQIRLKTVRSTVENGEVRYTCVAFIDSYRGLPFIDFHSISSTFMDSTLYSIESHSIENRKGEWWKRIYRFDKSARLFITEHDWLKDLKSEPYKPPSFDTLRIAWEKFQDGISLFYYARAHVHEKKSVAVPTIVNGKPGRTLFYFTGSKKIETIDSVPDPIRVVELEGKAEFEGVFGLTGDFKGWFTDDEAAVPVRAQMKVILGNINIELIGWDRKGWSPPQEP